MQIQIGSEITLESAFGVWVAVIVRETPSSWFTSDTNRIRKRDLRVLGLRPNAVKVRQAWPASYRGTL